MVSAVLASAVVGLLAFRTRRSFEWEDPVIALMLVSAGLMVVMCAALLLDGQWRGAAFMAPMAALVAVPAVVLGRKPSAAPPRLRDDDDGEGGGGGDGASPEEPPPGPPLPAIDWGRFDELRETWRRSPSRPAHEPTDAKPRTSPDGRGATPRAPSPAAAGRGASRCEV